MSLDANPDVNSLPWQVDVELDCRGMRCPLPIIRLADTNGELAAAETVAVVAALVADDPAARPGVAAWCRIHGQEYVGQDTARNGVPRHVVARVS